MKSTNLPRGGTEKKKNLYGSCPSENPWILIEWNISRAALCSMGVLNENMRARRPTMTAFSLKESKCETVCRPGCSRMQKKRPGCSRMLLVTIMNDKNLEIVQSTECSVSSHQMLFLISPTGAHPQAATDCTNVSNFFYYLKFCLNTTKWLWETP